MSSQKVNDYTNLADDYDKTRYEHKFGKFKDRLRKKAFAELLRPTKNMLLIDVGTGTGSGLAFFAKDVKSMVGLDGTPAMLSRAKEKLIGLGVESPELVCANALEIPYNDETFDNLISLNFVHLFAPQGLSKQGEFIAEMERIVRKEGSIIVEFDNVIYGKELGNRFKDLFKLSDTMRIEKVLGVNMPKAKALFGISESLAKIYTTLAWYFPFKYFARRWVVKFVKNCS